MAVRRPPSDPPTTIDFDILKANCENWKCKDVKGWRVGRSIGRLLCLRDGDVAAPDVDRFDWCIFRTITAVREINFIPKRVSHEYLFQVAGPYTIYVTVFFPK